MHINAISLYQPGWFDASGSRVPGRDEDEVTMCVAALGPLVMSGHKIERIIIITRSPSLLEGDIASIVATASRLKDAKVQLVLGGAPAVVDLLFSATPNTAIVAVEREDRAGAGAILLDHAGAVITESGVYSSSLPIRIREAGETFPRIYDDPRLLRELAWKPALNYLAKEGPCLTVGVPSKFAKSAGYHSPLSEEVAAGGPAAVAFALAQLADEGGGRLVAIEQATGAALTIEGSAEITHSVREGESLQQMRVEDSDGIPISLAAYSRAFESKVGFLAGLCEECGTLSFPPRYHCLGCSREGDVPLTILPRTASVYTMATIRIPVPGLASPYSVAIVELDDSDVRVLVQVTDVPAGTTPIGAAGRLVFRKVADRRGIPDYGYSFQPNERVREEVK